MRKRPPTSAQLRWRLQPLWTWVALTMIGAVASLVRHLIWGVPLLPLQIGFLPLIVATLVGAGYAAAILLWLALRRRWTR